MTREEAIAKAAGLSRTNEYSASETERHYINEKGEATSYILFDVAVDRVRSPGCKSYDEALEVLKIKLKEERAKRVKMLEKELEQAKKALE